MSLICNLVISVMMASKYYFMAVTNYQQQKRLFLPDKGRNCRWMGEQLKNLQDSMKNLSEVQIQTSFL